MFTRKLREQHKNREEGNKPTMSYEDPHPNQPAIDFATFGVAFNVGDQVVIWRGKWATMSGTIVGAGPDMLHVETLAGGVVRVWKNVCCLIVDVSDTEEEYPRENEAEMLNIPSDSSDDEE
jgi:hypothetical protein